MVREGKRIYWLNKGETKPCLPLSMLSDALRCWTCIDMSCFDLLPRRQRPTPVGHEGLATEWFRRLDQHNTIQHTNAMLSVRHVLNSPSDTVFQPGNIVGSHLKNQTAESQPALVLAAPIPFLASTSWLFLAPDAIPTGLLNALEKYRRFLECFL